jgi:hypothetical protein
MKQHEVATNGDHLNGHGGYVDAVHCLDALFPLSPAGTRGMSLRMFRRLQRAGKIPYLKIGRRTLFCPSDVRVALERRFKREAK